MSDKKALIESAQEATEGKACPICGNKKWDIGEGTYSLSSPGNSSNEVACAKCTNCGFVALFADT